MNQPNKRIRCQLMNWLEDIELKGSIVTLEPLNMDHVEPLQTAVKDGEFWKLWYARVPAPEQMEDYVTIAIADAGEEISHSPSESMKQKNCRNNAFLQCRRIE